MNNKWLPFFLIHPVQWINANKLCKKYSGLNCHLISHAEEERSYFKCSFSSASAAVDLEFVDIDLIQADGI